MAIFLQGDQLNGEIGKILQECEKELIIISPFIKLHSRYKDALKEKINNHKLQIIIVFGKNEKKIEKSIRVEDFEFWQQFPNIKIKYESRLHAKYYANESGAILSSMNLYDYSQNNNIEFGIFTETTFLSSLTGNITGNTLDKDAFDYFQRVINNSDILFEKTPVYDDGVFGVRKKYLYSNIVKDELSEKLKKQIVRKDNVININKNSQPKDLIGYCIRTGEEISFNPEKPLSDKAFKQWNRFKDKGYQEKFCHYSGEPSNGETSFAKPILRKHWSIATKILKNSN